MSIVIIRRGRGRRAERRRRMSENENGRGARAEAKRNAAVGDTGLKTPLLLLAGLFLDVFLPEKEALLSGEN